MFTGIVTDVGTVRSAEQRGDLRLVIETGYDMVTIDLGASIACSGACLTVVDKGDDWFAVDLSGETASKTAADRWREGARLNLERSLRLGDEIGGHIVTGHVDAVGTVEGVCLEGDSKRIGISVPRALGAMIAAKGSVALDGVSMTVNEVRDSIENVCKTGLGCGQAHDVDISIPISAALMFVAVHADDVFGSVSKIMSTNP